MRAYFCTLLLVFGVWWGTTSPEPREKVVLRVLGPATGETDVVWVQPMTVPTLALKVVKGKAPEKGVLQCRVEDQGVDRELEGVKGQFIVLNCEGNVVLGVARVEFGGER